MDSVIRIPPFQYIHVQDNNTNITRLEKGPATFIRQDHETIVSGPNNMIRLAPRQYCTILNPVILDAGKKPILTEFKQVKVLKGDLEIRTADQYSEPFPLYPGEELAGKIEKYLIIAQNQAIRLNATRDFEDKKLKVARKAGDEWQIPGAITYMPRVEESIVTVINNEVIKPKSALKITAKKDCKDCYGNKRRTGEEWLIREVGSYLPQIEEEIVGVVAGIVVTEKKALRLKARNDFKDIYGIQRKAGEEWLITSNLAQLHIPDVNEDYIGQVQATTLSNRQYCVILDPYDAKTKINKYGQKELRKGELTFFLQPGEKLENNKIEDVKVLTEDEALLLQAIEDLTDDNKEKRRAGERWLILGPREYIPPVEVIILDKRKRIPLDENEGIYIRDIQTGEVRMETGKTYLLQAHEELWEKELPEVVEQLLAEQKVGQAYIPSRTDESGNLVYEKRIVTNYKRDKTRAVTYRAPHNSAVQVYDFKLKSGRVVFGPSLLILGPYEEFTVINLSGGRPKKENLIKTLALQLGPDFMTDLVNVETSDHARLQIVLSYNWYFKYDKENQAECQKMFQVPDFVGDVCKSIASRIRGAVSSVTFTDFHKKRKDLIQNAVFGTNADGNSRPEFFLPANNLCITSVDVQNPEPVDPRMKESLFKAQTLNIDITTRTSELNAHHQALILEQESAGRLEIQKFNDQAEAESSKKELLVLKAENEVIKVKGKAVAIAHAEAEAELIHVEAEVNQAKLKAEALRIESTAEAEAKKQNNEAEVSHKKAVYDLEIKKSNDLAAIEVKKFKELVQAIGKETIVAMARAGPETQAKLLKGLGLKGFLISDGKNPINLFNTANGMLGSLDQNKK